MQPLHHPHLQHRADLFAGPAPRLLFTGDWAPVRRFRDLLAEYPGQLYDGEVVRCFAEADARVVNVEAVLAGETERKLLEPVYKEGPNLIGPDTAVKDLLALPADVGLLANNHAYDFGPEGLAATVRVLKESEIHTCGHGRNQDEAYQPCVLKIQDTEVALINFQEGEEGPHTYRAPELAGWDLGRVCRSIREQRQAGRRVIAVPHADREFLPLPAPYIQRAYRTLVEAGASAVIGHHPHVPRGVEVWQGCPIVYSLGNFAFWQEHPGLFRKLGLLAELALGDEGSPGLRLFPFRIEAGCIRALRPGEAEWLAEQLGAVSGPGLHPDRVKAHWEAAIDSLPLESWYEDCTGMAYGMQLMEQQDPAGLARLRTRLSSPAHTEFMTAGINRILSGQHGRSDPALRERVRLWTELANAGPFTNG